MLLMRKRVMNVYMKNQEQTDSTCDAEVHSYQCPAKRLEHLQELSHGWQRRLEFFSRSSLELLLEVANEDERTTFLARSRADDRDGLVAGWTKTSWRENKEQW
jgi:hypothetical protein